MSFTSPPERISVDGLLFDMDGTIIDSTAAVMKFWHAVGAEINVDPKVIMQTAHGRRTIDTLGVVRPEKANWEYVREIEGQLPKVYGQDAVEVPGARNLIDALVSVDAPWAIVTSGTAPLVRGWLDVMKLAPPDCIVTAESVEVGKPHPACYKLGQDKLKLGSKASVVVFEDSPAGIKAGKAAGCKVVGLVTTHTQEQVVAAEPDWVLQDLRSVRAIECASGSVTLDISNALTQNKP